MCSGSDFERKELEKTNIKEILIEVIFASNIILFGLIEVRRKDIE